MSGPSKEELRAQLRSAGLRATAPRVAVLCLLRESDRPLSHGEVVAKIGRDDWDRATLFRNLVKLEETGFARVASRMGGVTRYEFSHPSDAPHVHPHFACRSCGKVSCLKEATLQLPQVGEWKAALEDADLQLVGTCPSCRAQASVEGVA